MRAGDRELIGAALANIGDEDFPHPDVQTAAHDMAAGIPVVEVAHDREVHTCHALMLDQVRAHLVVQAEVIAFAHQEIVKGAQDRAEAVRIGDPPFRPVAPRAVLHRLGRAFDRSLEQAARIDALQFTQGRTGQVEGRDLLRARHQRPQERTARPFMRSQQRERIGVAALDQGIQSGTGWLHITFQISSAYCRMVRSEENHPTFATLWMAEVAQPAWSCQRASTLRCAAA